MIYQLAQFGAGLFAANAAEWFVHRYVLHGLGVNKSSFWAFHWHEHHRTCRLNDFKDDAYREWPRVGNAHGKEILSLLWLALLATPLTALSVPFVCGLWLSMVAYYIVHRKGHLSPEWARKWTPWHVEHHMKGKQNHSWCVTTPLLDWVLGTRWKDQARSRER